MDRKEHNRDTFGIGKEIIILTGCEWSIGREIKDKTYKNSLDKYIVALASKDKVLIIQETKV
jgi:hypothetical protein